MNSNALCKQQEPDTGGCVPHGPMCMTFWKRENHRHGKQVCAFQGLRWGEALPAPLGAMTLFCTLTTVYLYQKASNHQKGGFSCVLSIA